MPSQRKKPVNFRIGAAYFKRLEDDGAKIGMSPHEYARHLLRQILDDSARHDLLQEVQTSAAEIAALRRDLSRALQMLLLHVKPTSEVTPQYKELVRQWVSTHLDQPVVR